MGFEIVDDVALPTSGGTVDPDYAALVEGLKALPEGRARRVKVDGAVTYKRLDDDGNVVLGKKSGEEQLSLPVVKFNTELNKAAQAANVTVRRSFAEVDGGVVALLRVTERITRQKAEKADEK